MRTREEVRLVRQLAEDGLSQNAIARRTGIPHATVNRWLNGRPPRFDHPEASTCSACGHPRHEAIDGDAYSYVLGLYLGDGHLASFPRTKCLRIYLDASYPGIVEQCAGAIRRLMPSNRVAVHRKRGSVVVQCYSRQWACLLPQHGPGLKHTRRILLDDWQLEITTRHPEALIRGLIHSDGSRFMNPIRSKGRAYSYPRYFFSNRSEDIKAIFCAHLEILEIAWRRVGPYNISIARREAVAALDAFVGPKR